MSGNDSSTGGYLVPATTPAPIEGNDLTTFLHNLFQGLCGYAGSAIVPRWQPVPVNRPAITADWLAIGVQNRVADTYAIELYNATANSESVFRSERFEVLASFYGPNAEAYAELAREGLALGQNREYIEAHDVSFIDCGDTISVPSLENGQWYFRVDMPVRFRRLIQRIYPILNILSADITLTTDVPHIVDTKTVTQ